MSPKPIHVSNGYTFYFLVAILLLSLILRFYKIAEHGIFFDEKATMLVSQGIVQDGGNQHNTFDKGKLIFTNQEFWKEKKLPDYYEAMTRSDIGNSPFYYFLLHNWMKVFGISDYSARAMSAIFSTLLVLMIFVFTKHFFKSDELALTASLLAAIEPFFITYAQQARNYSLTFFLTLLGTYYFLRALEYPKANNYKWYVAYALTMLLALYSHFLSATVLLAHGLYVLLFVRDLKAWLKIGIAAGFAIAGLVWWLTDGGGQWTLYSLNHQSKVYLECATNRPYNNPYGIILPATVGNVLQKSLPIFTDLWIFTNGIIDKVVGKKNIVVAILLGILLIISHYLYLKQIASNKWFVVAPIFLFATSTILFRQQTFVFWVLAVGIFMIYLAITAILNSSTIATKLVWFLLIMAIIPTAFLIFNTFRSGHTYGLTQRYSGFSFPYVVILAALALRQIKYLVPWMKYSITIILMVQVFFIAQTLMTIYADRSVKYNYRATPRVANPHYEAAQKAINLYQTGDTLILPAPLAKFDNPMDKTYLPYSVVDAQYFNLYLPKERIFVQKLDTVQTHRIVLQKHSGQIIELINLEGKRY